MTDPENTPKQELSTHGSRFAGKKIDAVMHFIAEGECGHRVVYATPNGSFYSPEAHKAELAAALSAWDSDPTNPKNVEIERLSKWYGKARCVYCDQAFDVLPTDENASNIINAAHIANHVMNCEKNPAMKWKRENDTLQSELTALRERVKELLLDWGRKRDRYLAERETANGTDIVNKGVKASQMARCIEHLRATVFPAHIVHGEELGTVNWPNGRSDLPTPPEGTKTGVKP